MTESTQTGAPAPTGTPPQTGVGQSGAGQTGAGQTGAGRTGDVPGDGAPLNTVTWWELPVTDVARAKEFYTAVFGWTYTSFGDDASYVGVMNGSDLVGGLYRADATTGTGAAIRAYVNVADLEATLAAVEAAGGSVLVPRTEIGGDMGWWAEIGDPDGRWLGLCTGRAT